MPTIQGSTISGEPVSFRIPNRSSKATFIKALERATGEPNVGWKALSGLVVVAEAMDKYKETSTPVEISSNELTFLKHQYGHDSRDDFPRSWRNTRGRPPLPETMEKINANDELLIFRSQCDPSYLTYFERGDCESLVMAVVQFNGLALQFASERLK